MENKKRKICENEFCEFIAVEEYCGLEFCFIHYLLLKLNKRVEGIHGKRKKAVQNGSVSVLERVEEGNRE